MKNHLLNIALNLEMTITKHAEKKYHSERSRNKDIIATFKEIVRHEEDTTEDPAEAMFIYTVSYLLSNAMLDELTSDQINEVYSLVIRLLKQNFVEDEDRPIVSEQVTRTTTTYTHEDFFGRK